MGKEQSPDKLQRAISSILGELKCKDQLVVQKVLAKRKLYLDE